MKTTYLASVVTLLAFALFWAGGANAFACCKNTCTPPLPSCPPCVLNLGEDCGAGKHCDSPSGCHTEAMSLGLSTESVFKRQGDQHAAIMAEVGAKLHNPTQCAFAHQCDPAQCATEAIDEAIVKKDEGQAQT